MKQKSKIIFQMALQMQISVFHLFFLLFCYSCPVPGITNEKFHPSWPSVPKTIKKGKKDAGMAGIVGIGSFIM